MLEETLGGTGNISSHHAEFVVTPVTSTGGAREFRQSMVPHPLVHQELPHEPHFGIYNGRLRSLSYAKGSADDIYWRLRRSVMLSHTGECQQRFAARTPRRCSIEFLPAALARFVLVAAATRSRAIPMVASLWTES